MALAVGRCCILVLSLLPGHLPSSFLSAQAKRGCLIQPSATLQSRVGQLSEPLLQWVVGSRQVGGDPGQCWPHAEHLSVRRSCCHAPAGTPCWEALREAITDTSPCQPRATPTPTAGQSQAPLLSEERPVSSRTR